MTKWTFHSVDHELRSTLLPDTLCGSAADALTHATLLLPQHAGADRLEISSDDLLGAEPTSLDDPSPIIFELCQRPQRDGGGWRLTNDQVLPYSMWYDRWRSAISYAAFAARGQELAVRILDQTSALRKLLLVVRPTMRSAYTDGLRFPGPANR